MELNNKVKFKETEIGIIPEEWEILSLNSFLIAKNQGVNTTTEKVSYSNTGIPIVRANNVSDYNIDYEDLVYVDDINYLKIRKECRPKDGDVLYTPIGSQFGSAALVKENKEFGIAWNVMRMQPDNKKITSSFLVYLLNNPENKMKIRSLNTSSTMPFVSGIELGKTKFSIPSIDEQKRITEILSSLDDKIELNRKINSNLEKLASLLFKQWFVDFEFPNENGEPYKSSGGKMNDSELGEIPKGWRIGKLKELIVKNNGQFKKQREWIDKNIIDLSVMPNFSICIEQFSDGIKFSTNIKSLKKYDLLFGSIRPYFGKVGFSPIDGGVTGTVFSFLPKHKDFYSFILSIVSSGVFIDYTVQNSRGTKMPVINWNDMVDYNVVIPKLETVADFNNIVFRFIEMMRSNIEENMRLSRLRNLLLPRLMNGKLRVK